MKAYFQSPITMILPIFHLLEWIYDVKSGGRWYFLFESNKVYRTKISWKSNSHFLSFVTTIPPSNILLLRVNMYVHSKDTNGNPLLGRLTVANIRVSISSLRTYPQFISKSYPQYLDIYALLHILLVLSKMDLPPFSCMVFHWYSIGVQSL